MKELITEDQTHLLWQDEIGDDFLLLQHGEIYRYSEDQIGIYCWNRKTSKELKKEGLIDEVVDTDDPFDIFYASVCNLSQIMTILGIPSRRFNENSQWIRDLEERLNHRIIPFNPGEVGRRSGADETPDVEIQREEMSMQDAGGEQPSQSDVSGNKRGGVAPVESEQQADETTGD